MTQVCDYTCYSQSSPPVIQHTDSTGPRLAAFSTQTVKTVQLGLSFSKCMQRQDSVIIINHVNIQIALLSVCLWVCALYSAVISLNAREAQFSNADCMFVGTALW